MSGAPLADRLRPTELEDVQGQEGILGPGTLLRSALETGAVPSLVLWGPPGTGKTTLARLLAGRSGIVFEALSAVTSGVKDVRAVIARARARRAKAAEGPESQGRENEGAAGRENEGAAGRENEGAAGRENEGAAGRENEGAAGRENEGAEDEGGTLLFVDEIHRFNRAQQDAFLPHIEDGTIVLVGATTENPGFSLIGALLSRLRVVVLEPIDEAGLLRILERALEDIELGLAGRFELDEEAQRGLVAISGGDARKMLNVLESATQLARARGEGREVSAEVVREAAQSRLLAYDRSGDGRYDLLSAFHKSLRGSDVDACLFWMGRMLEGGEEPLVIVRRLVAMAAEDIGLADPHALRLALDAKDAISFLGQPEGELALTQAVIYLATAPKSNSVVKALKASRAAARKHMDEPVPLQIRNAPTRLARELGHGKGYKYPHDFPHAFAPQAYLPKAAQGLELYKPLEVGAERETSKRWAWWRKLRGRGRDA